MNDQKSSPQSMVNFKTVHIIVQRLFRWLKIDSATFHLDSLCHAFLNRREGAWVLGDDDPLASDIHGSWGTWLGGDLSFGWRWPTCSTASGGEKGELELGRGTRRGVADKTTFSNCQTAHTWLPFCLNMLQTKLSQVLLKRNFLPEKIYRGIPLLDAIFRCVSLIWLNFYWWTPRAMLSFIES